MNKKIQKLNKIFSIGVLVLLFILFIQIIIGEGIYKISGINIGKLESRSDDTYCINWYELYPFPADITTNSDYYQLTGEQHVKLSEIFNLYYKVFNKLGTVGEIWDSHIIMYDDIAKLGYIFNACVSDPGRGGQFVRLTNGYWTTVSEEEDMRIVKEKVRAIDELNDYLDDNNIPFLYVQSAVKNCKYDMKLPIGVKDYTNEDIDRLLLGLENEGIEYIDMREVLHEDFDGHYELFYKTDHHWNIDTGFWACNVIEDAVETKYDVGFDKTYNSLTMYSKKTWDNAMFGSAGQAVTHFLADSEDFSVLFPNFETNFELVIPDKNISSKGNFEDLFIDYDILEEVIDGGGGYAYETLLYGNRPLVQITNNNNENGPKVLMIRDSFSIAVAPYMAIGCSELDLIDTRPANGNFTGSVRNYIAQMQPDIVIMLVNYPETAYK